MPRVPDRITVEAAGGVFDKFESLSIVNDIVGLSEARFEVGDDGAWPELAGLVAPGTDFRVLLNGQPRLVGRAEVNEAPISADGGAQLTLTVRTKRSDAMYRSAPEKVRVEGTSVKEFVLACYAPLGYVEADFVFAPFAARELMTGKAQGGGAPPTNLEPLKVDQAKVQPGETITQAVERHLARYHATHWDAPDGRIVVGVPDDQQGPIGRLQAKRGPESIGNNVLTCRRIRDWSDVAQSVTVFGQDQGKSTTRKRIVGAAFDEDVTEVAVATGHFERAVVVSGSQAKDQGHADALAARELSARIRRKSAFDFTVDGWTYWTGDAQIPYANDTTFDVDVDALGTEAQGRYLVARVELQLSTGQAATTKLTAVAPGIWVV
jgi:prophage tail gpP-like protein